MATYHTDATTLALINAGLPPDEQVGGYWEMTQDERNKEARDQEYHLGTLRLQALARERTKHHY